jgi:hypothetical protein
VAPITKKKRKHSQGNSVASNKSGSICEVSTKSFAPKSKLAPIVVAPIKSKVESPKKQQISPSPKKKGSPDLNYQRSKSARPSRKSLIQQKKASKQESDSVYQQSNFDTQSRGSFMTAYSNPFLMSHSAAVVPTIQEQPSGPDLSESGHTITDI